MRFRTSDVREEYVEKMRRLLEYIYANQIELCIGFMQESGNCLSAESFTGMVKHVLGEECDFLLVDGEESVEIVDTKEKCTVGTIHGELPHAYHRGDTRSATLKFQYAVSKGYLFVRDKRVALLDNDRAVRYDGKGEFFVIERSTKTLRRFLDGELLWVSEIPVNYVDTFYLSHEFNYPDETFPQGLIAVNDSFRAHMFFKETGEYYGAFQIKRGYIRIQEAH
ncbi:MAG: hypothetical protein IJX63_04690 [Lachnospiraceae bacterium]|nr:hypothetical protein [Lachnospiraceae bacterium]